AKAAEYGAAAGVAYDYAPMLAPMKPILDPADVAICHMEVPSAPDGEPVTSYPSFGAPPELVDGAKSAGYDGCSTASNHSLDRGKAGLKRLLDQFDAVGLSHNGTARTAEEGGGVATVYDIDGVKVANISFAYGFNGYKIPEDAPWSVNEISVAAIEEASAKARADGADLVVISLHWGNEYQHDPSDYQRDIAGQLLPSPDIDVIVGHHAHVVQPIEKVDGTYVVFGLGNQVSNQTQLPRRDGLTARLTAVRAADGSWSVTSVEAIPTFVDLPSFRVLPVVDTMADPATPAGLREQLSGSYDRTAEVINGPGTLGVTLAPKP
ncbi:MAG: CapA family protein, partial [Aquihabitans sp.]